MTRTTYRTETVGRFTLKTRIGSGEWAVHVDGTDPNTPTLLGFVRQNGSRLRERSWTWTTADRGVFPKAEGKAGSRKWAAEALARHLSA